MVSLTYSKSFFKKEVMLRFRYHDNKYTCKNSFREKIFERKVLIQVNNLKRIDSKMEALFPAKVCTVIVWPFTWQNLS